MKPTQLVALTAIIYGIIKIAGFICATIIAIKVNMWVGAGLFVAILSMRHEFKATDPE